MKYDNELHKSVNVRLTGKICDTYWQEFTNITEEDAIEYAKERFLDKLPWGWEVEDIEVEDIEVETFVEDDGD